MEHGKLGYAHTCPSRPWVDLPHDHASCSSRARAYAEVLAEGPDAELDLQGFDKPLWGNHSFRRFADMVARQTMAQTGASEQDH